MKIYNLMCIHEKPYEQAEASAMPYASFDLASDQMKKECRSWRVKKLRLSKAAIMKAVFLVRVRF